MEFRWLWLPLLVGNVLYAAMQLSLFMAVWFWPLLPIPVLLGLASLYLVARLSGTRRRILSVVLALGAAGSWA